MTEINKKQLAEALLVPVRVKAEKSVACMYGAGAEINPGIPDWLETRGAGLLLEVLERFFLITCRHILDLNDEPSRFGVAFGIGWKGNPLKILKDQLDLSNTTTEDDVAVFELNSAQISLLNQHGAMKPLKLDDVYPFYYEEGIDLVSVIGYPLERAKTDLKTKEVYSEAIIYCSNVTNRQPSLTSYDMTRNLLIEFDQKHHIDHHGNDMSHQSPIGLSGGPVFALRANKKLSEIWTPEDLKYIGVATTWLVKSKELLVTRISVVLELMAKKWPELGEVFLEKFDTWQP